MSIASEITRISGKVSDSFDAVVAKGGTVTSRKIADLPTAIGTISGGGGGSEWQPDPDWWDIETILTQDTRQYNGKAIILYSNGDDFTTFTISSPIVAVETSDGSFYTSTTNHTWDRTKDKPVSGDTGDTTPKFATRYVKIYFNTASVDYTKLNDYYKGSIYAVFGCNLTKTSSSYVGTNTFFYNNKTLQSFKFLSGYNLGFGTNFSSFCSSCSSLQKLPDNLDVSSGTNFSNFCNSCSSLQKLPDDLDVSSGTNFNGFCSNCSSLQKLPDDLDVSSGTNFSSFCSNCSSLQKLPDDLDASSGTNFAGFCTSCVSLVKANIRLASVSVTALSSSNYINIESLQYIADNAPTGSGLTLTIGSTNITRAGGASGSVISTLTNKGWTVN